MREIAALEQRGFEPGPDAARGRDLDVVHQVQQVAQSAQRLARDTCGLGLTERGPECDARAVAVPPDPVPLEYGQALA